MDSITAPQSSASSASDPGPAYAQLLGHLRRLTVPAGRDEAARALAGYLGAQDLLIFIRDLEVDLLLPAPGFPQTLPRGHAWQAFLGRCATGGPQTAILPFPTDGTLGPALGLADAEGAVLVLLGGDPRLADARAATLALPLLTAAFCGEQAAQIARSHAGLSRAAAAQAQTLLAALDAARRELQAALQVRDQFLLIAAHELKTPLTVLLGYTQLLQRRAAAEGTLNARDQHALEVIAARAGKLHHLIEELLDVNRIQTGQLTLAWRRIDLRNLVQQLVAEIQATLERHSLDLHCPAMPVFLDADEIRIEQVLQNLLHNAVKFSPAGGTIRVALVASADRIVLTVADPGMGIPPAAQAQIFDRFYRAGNATREHITGMGIGLYLVQEIVTAHGGTVTVASTEGLGSTFTVTLPWTVC